MNSDDMKKISNQTVCFPIINESQRNNNSPFIEEFPIDLSNSICEY